MRALRGTKQLTLAGLLSTVRSKAALFWTLAFPIFLLVIFAFIFGGGDGDRVSYLLPGLWTITVISASFFGLSMVMVQERENGTFRRYRVTPVSPVAVVTSFAIVQLLTLAASLLLQSLVAKLAFGITSQGSVLLVVLMLFLGCLAFVPLGLIVGSVARDMKIAPVLTNLIFFPMMFLSGAAVPFFFLPKAVQAVARLLPATYLVESVQGVMVRGEGLAQLQAPVIVMLVTAAVGLALNGLLFRWESSQSIPRRNIALAVGGILAIYVVAALVAPELRMAIQPK